MHGLKILCGVRDLKKKKKKVIFYCNFLWNWKRGGHTETLLIFVFGCNADELLDLEI